MTAPKFDLYQTITDQIVAALEAGLKGDGQPLWSGQGAAGLPFNRVSRRAYSGVNVLVLWLTAAAKGYTSPAWLTYKQATELGGTVRKGEKSTHICYFRTLEREEIDPSTGEIEERTIPMLRSYAVFNVEQCDGLPPLPAGERFPFQGIEAAEILLESSNAAWHEGGTRAFYSPILDKIHMPDRDRFPRPESFYAVALHELTHWTGHTSRLARDFSGRFGSESYAFEELVAEIGSAFLGAEIGITPVTLPDHAGYLASWLKVLKNDKKAIFTAASQASKAHAYIMGLAQATTTETMAA
jgi:antirestriction protein ArdC